MGNATILHLKAVAHAEDGAVVRARERVALEDVERLLAAANEVLTEAQADAVALRETARKEGFEQGLAEAHAEMTEALTEQHRRGHALYEAQTADVQEMALAIVERLAPGLDAAEFVQPMVARAILAAQADQYLQVRVHPDQFGVAQAAIDELGHVHPAVAAYQVIADDTVEPLACVVQTEVGAVRASFAQQLESVRAALSAPMADDGATTGER